ncbi:acyl-CoA N-acyltransferase [Clohesyomyces aquaticus]|uniref:Acyl-CoA N-acyltransferase n=1 Tax=Clohesyomyces aquaticus TaxID=1231657 RepID=A0A1Y1ZGM4_9PLEO|nr:acyl-CoA N-acyltransferase [Clohesyomyces aquaticus]
MVLAPSKPNSEPKAVYLKDLASFSPKERPTFIHRVSKIERKVFPSSEAFDFNSELKKKNCNLTLALKDTDTGDGPQLVGYLVSVRMKRLALLHKICVVDQERGWGIGKCLIHSLRLQLEKGGCRSIQLWVDEDRKPARALYKSYGFQEIDRCIDYYGPGRTGLKMEFTIES